MKLSEYQKSRSFFDLGQRSLRFQRKCLTFGLYTQVSDSGPQGPLVDNLFLVLAGVRRALSGDYGDEEDSD